VLPFLSSNFDGPSSGQVVLDPGASHRIDLSMMAPPEPKVLPSNPPIISDTNSNVSYYEIEVSGSQTGPVIASNKQELTINGECACR